MTNVVHIFLIMIFFIAGIAAGTTIKQISTEVVSAATPPPTPSPTASPTPCPAPEDPEKPCPTPLPSPSPTLMP